MLATVKAPFRVPPLMEHVAWVMGVPESEHEVSELRKPEPETCTVVAGLADVGLKASDGGSAFTVKVVDAESPTWFPVAATGYAAKVTLATVNEPLSAPPETEHVGEATTVPDIEHDVSLVEYPEPDTCTVNPIEPKSGLSERDGAVNVALVLVISVVPVKLVEVEVVVVVVLDVALLT